jgi:hypothetical protein
MEGHKNIVRSLKGDGEMEPFTAFAGTLPPGTAGIRWEAVYCDAKCVAAFSLTASPPRGMSGKRMKADCLREHLFLSAGFAAVWKIERFR